MLKIMHSVGYGGRNNPIDVAVVQFALKIVPIGPRKSANIRTYWPSLIDGKHTYKLDYAISNFKHDYFSEKELGEPALLSESIEAFSGPNSKALKRLFEKLPPSYRRAQYVYEQFSSYVFIFQITSESPGNIAHTEQDLAMPNKDARALLKHLRLIRQGYKILATIDDVTISQNGEFIVRIGLGSGRMIDRTTGKVSDVQSSKARLEMKDFIVSTINRPIYPAAARWKVLQANNEILLKTKKQYSVLKLSAGTKTWIRWQLGNHQTKFQKAAVERALDAYDKHRIGGTLTPATERFMIEVFGDDWKSIEASLSNRQRIASDYKRRLKTLLSDSDKIKKTLLQKENELRRLLGIEPNNLLGMLLEEILDRRLKKRRKARRKTTPKDDEVTDETFNLMAETGQILVSGFGGDKPDALDLLLYGVSIVALVALAAGTLGVGVAGFAMVAAAGRAVSTAVEVASYAKFGYDLIGAYLENEELEDDIAAIKIDLINYSTQLDAVALQLKTLIHAIRAEDFLSLPDFCFTNEQLSEAVREISIAQQK